MPEWAFLGVETSKIEEIRQPDEWVAGKSYRWIGTDLKSEKGWVVAPWSMPYPGVVP